MNNSRVADSFVVRCRGAAEVKLTGEVANQIADHIMDLEDQLRITKARQNKDCVRCLELSPTVEGKPHATK